MVAPVPVVVLRGCVAAAVTHRAADPARVLALGCATEPNGYGEVG